MSSRLLTVYLLLVITLSGCGAKKPSITISLNEGSHIEVNDTIIPVLLSYKNSETGDSGYKLNPQSRENINDLEAKFTDCLIRISKQNDLPIIISTLDEPSRKQINFKEFQDDYFGESFIKELKHRPDEYKWSIDGLRYLVLMNVETSLWAEVENHSDFEWKYNQLPWGWYAFGSEGKKTTEARIGILDLRNKELVGKFSIFSSGPHGWVAGAYHFVFIPFLPFYVPFWAETESEICNPMGRQILEMLQAEKLK